MAKATVYTQRAYECIKDMVLENGWVVLHMDNYGIKDVEGAARAAEAVMEL